MTVTEAANSAGIKSRCWHRYRHSSLSSPSAYATASSQLLARPSAQAVVKVVSSRASRTGGTFCSLVGNSALPD